MLPFINTIRRSIKHSILGYSCVQKKVLLATCNDSSVPSQADLYYLAEKSWDPEHLPDIMDVIWRKIFTLTGPRRHIEKSAKLLYFLLIHGNEQIITMANEHFVLFAGLKNYKEDDLKGATVREEGLQLTNLLRKPMLLDNLRAQAGNSRDNVKRSEPLKGIPTGMWLYQKWPLPTLRVPSVLRSLRLKPRFLLECHFVATTP
uniref:ENTH domain-containing protein n=1 Tax=Caenorhabditis tropicalis TaxID=1561998 RepID=A0A1I7T207_9PELO